METLWAILVCALLDALRWRGEAAARPKITNRNYDTYARLVLAAGYIHHHRDCWDVEANATRLATPIKCAPLCPFPDQICVSRRSRARALTYQCDDVPRDCANALEEYLGRAEPKVRRLGQELRPERRPKAKRGRRRQHRPRFLSLHIGFREDP